MGFAEDAAAGVERAVEFLFCFGFAAPAGECHREVVPGGEGAGMLYSACTAAQGEDGPLFGFGFVEAA